MIRRLTPGDVALWKEIRQAALEDAAHAFGRTLASFHAQSDDEHRDRLASSHDYGAFAAGGQIVGSASWRPIGEPGTAEAHRAGVYSVFVRPEWQGRGLADALMARVIEEASATMLQLELDVVADNARAIRFYRRLGFEEIGLTPRALRRGEGFADELRMILRLDA
jgi:ribosomal protein S18 acetylase RimI-like enzyme